jgi:hypothetical protein
MNLYKINEIIFFIFYYNFYHLLYKDYNIYLYIYIMLNQPRTINQVGKKVGDYKFIKFLGMGSFAEVIKRIL